jgi:hypothetical protein
MPRKPSNALARATLRKMEADARLREQEYQRRSGELVSVALVVSALSGAFADMKKVVTASPLAPEERDEILRAMQKCLADASALQLAKAHANGRAAPALNRRGRQHGSTNQAGRQD